MTYPNFENKHLEQALFSPQDFVKFAYSKKAAIPKKWILIFNKDLEKHVRRKYSLKRIHDNVLCGKLYVHKKIGILRFEGIGSPNAVTVMEELIGMGAKEFIVIGTAGGLEQTGIFVCEKAIRDEGTSHHYIPHGKYAYPDRRLSEKLERGMKKAGLDFERATTWTIDAPYRETKAEVAHYKNEGVKTVEMEASALFAVAEVRKAKIAAVFVVEDLLGNDSWNPHYDKKELLSMLTILVDVSLGCFSSKK